MDPVKLIDRYSDKLLELISFAFFMENFFLALLVNL